MNLFPVKEMEMPHLYWKNVPQVLKLRLLYLLSRIMLPVCLSGQKYQQIRCAILITFAYNAKNDVGSMHTCDLSLHYYHDFLITNKEEREDSKKA